MAYKIDPGTDSNWQLRYTDEKIADAETYNGRYIPPFAIPGRFQSQFIAVGINVTNSREHWRWGGYIAQEFDYEEGAYLDSGKAFYRTEGLIINRVTILKLPVASTQPYLLKYFPPHWFLKMRIQVWEYTGEVVDDGDNDSVVNKDLQSLRELVELRFDELNTRLDNADIPAKLISISERLDRIEQQLNNGTEDEELSTSTPQGRFFLAN